MMADDDKQKPKSLFETFAEPYRVRGKLAELLTMSRDRKALQFKSETITPIEYVQGNYVERTDIIVWHGDRVINSVYWHEESTYTHKGYNVEYRWRERQCKVDTYDHCLRIEPVSPQYLRAQLCAIVEQIPDRDLLEQLEILRTCVVWEGEKQT